MKFKLLAIPLLAVAALSLSYPANALGPFDKFKKKAKEALEKTIEETSGEKMPSLPDAGGPGAGQEGAATTGQNAGNGKVDPGSPPPHGRWQGQMDARSQQSLIGYGSLDIVLSDDAKVLRYANAANRCLAELTGANGDYEASFVTGQSFCGNKAHLRLDADGDARIEWIDAPDTADNERIYSASLTQTTQAWPDNWSADAETRSGVDIVGFAPGMTYEAAVAHMKTEHADLKNELRMIVDPGSTSLVLHLESSQLKVGEPGQQIDMVFAAQTPDEMEVEQDPDVLARREEINKMQEARAEKLQQMRQARANRRRTASASNSAKPEDLPPIPEMPGLRPPGADAELLAVHRKVVFAQGARPHEQNVMNALVQKYGAPSVRIDQGTTRKLQWAFDAQGKRIADAGEGPCDHIWKAPGRIDGLVTWYGQKAVFATVSPRCGLTVKAELRYNDRDGGVWQMDVTAYDQQRLLGDEWDKIREFSAGYLAEEKAKTEATKKTDVPDL